MNHLVLNAVGLEKLLNFSMDQDEPLKELILIKANKQYSLCRVCKGKLESLHTGARVGIDTYVLEELWLLIDTPLDITFINPIIPPEGKLYLSADDYISDLVTNKTLPKQICN